MRERMSSLRGDSARSNRCRFPLLAILASAILPVPAGWGEETSTHGSESPLKKETAEATTWEEPNMFPQEPELERRPPIPVRQKPSMSAERPLEEQSQISPDYDSASQHAATTAQTDFGNPGSAGSPGLGLESTRDRELLMALSKGNGTSQPYNIKIGPIPFRMSAGVDIELTDNSQRSNLNKESELILLPRIDITGAVRLTSFASLNLSLGVGYIKYLNRTENDRVLPLAAASLNSEAGVGFNIKIGKFVINVFDRPETPQFQANAVTQRTQTQYQQFSNVAGVSVLWNMNSRTNATFRYAHSNTISLGSETSSTDSSGDSFLTSLSCKLSDSLGVGLEAGTSTTKYKTQFLNDSTTYHAGPFVNLRASEFLQIQASAGYQGGTYGSGGAVGDDSSLSSYYANVTLSNSLNPKLNHSLSLGHESRVGAFSNSTEVNYVRYQATWHVIRVAGIGFFASYEDIQESGGLFAQHFHNLTIGLSTALQLSRHISIGLAYEFTSRDGDASDDSLTGNSLAFDENRISIRLSYIF